MLALALLLALQIPVSEGYVTDKAAILTYQERTSLEARLRTYEGESGNQMAVLILPTLGGETIEQVANQVFHDWSIGQKGKDNGILILWSTGDRRVRIEVGYGLEDRLPDGRAGEIIRQDILPNFKLGYYVIGLNAGLTSIMQQLQIPSHSAPLSASPYAANEGDLSPWVIWSLSALGLFMVGGFIWFFHLEERRRNEAERLARDARLDGAKKKVHDDLSHRLHYKEAPERGGILPRLLPSAKPVHKVEDSSAPDFWGPSISTVVRDDTPSSSSWDSSSSGGFGGGDSGGGGASGSY